MQEENGARTHLRRSVDLEYEAGRGSHEQQPRLGPLGIVLVLLLTLLLLLRKEQTGHREGRGGGGAGGGHTTATAAGQGTRQSIAEAARTEPLGEDPLEDTLAEQEDVGARLTTLFARLRLVVRYDAAWQRGKKTGIRNKLCTKASF